MADDRSLREKLVAMASQDESPAERDIARAKLAAMDAQAIADVGAFSAGVAESMAEMARALSDLQAKIGRQVRAHKQESAQ